MAGCFCFCSPKYRVRSKRALISPSHHQIQEPAPGSLVPPPEPTKKANTDVPAELPTQSNLIEQLPVEQLELDPKLKKKKKKKVAFNLNVETFELPAEVVSDCYPERAEEGNEIAEEGETLKEGILLHSENSTSCEVSLPSSPLDDRYESCGSSDDEFEDIEAEETDENDDGFDRKELPGQHNVIEQESSESLFSLSIDSRKHVCAPEAEEKEVTSPMPIKGSEKNECRSNGLNRNAELGSKTRATSPLKNRDKENREIEEDFPVLFNPEPAPTPPLNQISTKSNRKENAVHMSLSSWLNEPETTPKSKTSSQSVGYSSSRQFNTPRSAEGRSVLGLLTMEDLRQLPSSHSTRQSSGKSPNETPMIGTVGSYWSHTGRQWIQVRDRPAEE